MGKLGQNEPSDALKALSQTFVRQVFVLAIIESIGATALVVLSLLEIISHETMTTGVLIWLGIVSIPLLYVMRNFKKKKALLQKAEDPGLQRPNPIQRN